MNILALVRDSGNLTKVVNYADKILAAGDSLFVLNIINVPGDIPTKPSGEVLDFCTEFDLSPFLNEQKQNEEWLSQVSVPEITVKTESAVGNQYSILKDRIDTNRIELVITSSAQTTEILDLIKKTKAGILHDQYNVPVLAFKEDSRCDGINSIGIVSDFENPSDFDLTVLRKIIQNTGGKCRQFAFCEDMSVTDALQKRMVEFSEYHQLGSLPNEVIKTEDKEYSVQELVKDSEIDMLVILDIHRHGLKRALRGDLESDLLNHTCTLILSY